MTDVLTKAQRRLNMSRIQGRDTRPELILRGGLHQLGLRFRLNRKNLPGSPDLVFPGPRAVIFVHGCFWHMHQCPMFKWPTTRPEFWQKKLSRNHQRDFDAVRALTEAGWRVLVVWECAMRGPGRHPLNDLLNRCRDFVRNEKGVFSEIGGCQGRRQDVQLGHGTCRSACRSACGSCPSRSSNRPKSCTQP